TPGSNGARATGWWPSGTRARSDAHSRPYPDAGAGGAGVGGRGPGGALAGAAAALSLGAAARATGRWRPGRDGRVATIRAAQLSDMVGVGDVGRPRGASGPLSARPGYH